MIKGQENRITLLHPHIDPAEQEAGTHYSQINVNDVTLKIGLHDSCFMTEEGNVYMLVNILHQEEDSIVLIGNKFLNSDDFYTYPMKSPQIGIMKVYQFS